MTKRFQVFLAIVLVLSLAIGIARPTTAVRAAETKNIVILGTSDIHGNVDNYDYFSGTVPTGTSQRGLTKVWTYAQTVKASNPNTILIDNGDTIQGTPLSYYFDVLDTSVENPLALAMDTMGYVSATVGNHEFNYGPTVFNKYKADASFPLLSANVTGCTDYTFTPYVIKDVDGVQVGILGLTPPAVKYWERPENIVGCVFGDAVDAAKNYVPIMKAAGADVIVVAAHSGLDATYGYGREENFITYLANEVPGIDVILAGHDHAKLASQIINGVLVTNPGNWTYYISDIRVTVTGSGSDWAVTAKSSTNQSMAAPAEDPGLVALLKPYHDTAVSYINTPIGTATAAFPGGFPARVADGPTADLINQVQMDAAEAAGFPVDASLAALFNNSAYLDAGPIKLKDAYRLYIYDNTLYVVEATGQMVKNELEWTANYFNQYFYEPAGVTVNSAVRDYNYDLWSGIEYKLDVTKPVGQRVVELTLNGEPLAMDQTIKVALNNYRATNKALFGQAKILYQSTDQVRDLIVNWIEARGTISPNDVFVQNYTLLPPVNTWVSTSSANPITNADAAALLWTAFDSSPDEFMSFPGYEGVPGKSLNRGEFFYLLGGKAMADLQDIMPDIKILKDYKDINRVLGWEKEAVAYLIQAGIFMPVDNKILPTQLVTNAEALAWVREARYPLYTFLSTNDFHGQLETGKLVSSKLVGGSAFNMTYINNYRALNPVGTTLMDAGDMMQGTTISNLLFGRSVIDVYNQMGYAVSVTGNHEFDWGLDVLQQRMDQAKFPILVANIFLAGTDTRPDWAVPTTMLTVKGQQVGVIGVTSKETPSIVMAGNVAGLEFRDVGPIVNELAAQLRAEGADIVVVLAHMPDVYGGVVSGEMLTVAQPGVDLIISGHSHSGYSGKINNIPIIQQYSSGTAIGVSDLRYDRVLRNILSSNLQVVTTWNTGITPDATIAAMVAAYQAEVAPLVNRPIATTLGTISRGPDRYTGEVPMGDLIADAQRWKGGTQIAFMNPGGIRADILYTTYPHVVTWGDFFTVQPFDNKLVTMKLTGAQIYAVLEQQFKPPQSSMKLLQQSGLKYQFNLANPVGSRILNLTLEDGTPIANDNSAQYTVTLNEFIATGGDNFSAFLGGTNVTKIWVSDLDALIEYVQFKYGVPPSNTPIDPSVYPKIEGRMTNVTP
ncbi:MAG: 5'-nucleotidase C-terminal domain-containing protein [Anaerolineaceae bacterium]